jgi:hypothetical protein
VANAISPPLAWSALAALGNLLSAALLAARKWAPGVVLRMGRFLSGSTSPGGPGGVYRTIVDSPHPKTPEEDLFWWRVLLVIAFVTTPLAIALAFGIGR